MSQHSSTRTPTPFHHARVGSRSGGSRSVLSSPRSILSSPRTSRSHASTAVSSWVDDVSSRSSSSSPSEWVIPGAPSYAAPHPPRLLSPNPSHLIPPPAFPSHANSGHHPPSTAMSYAPPPASDLGSVSSRRSKSSAHTRSSTRNRAEQDGNGNSALRDLDTVPCQICLQPAAVCTCVGGEEARLMMRRAACQALGRTSTAGSESRRSHRGQEPQVAPQAWGSGYAWQGSGYAAGYGAPMAYAGSSGTVYSGQAAAMGGYGAGDYGSPVAVPMSQTSSWVDEQRGVSGPVWGVRGG
ncbi:hypothetical protein V8D89_001174 [Ganoderma adspersum]